MSANENNSDIFKRESELIGLFKSKEFILSANRLFDFVSDFGKSREWKQDAISFCNRAHTIHDFDRRKKFKGIDDFLEKITELLFDMMELLDTIIAQLTSRQAA